MDDHSDLKEKIGEAKRRLPLPELMAREGLGEHAKKEAHCPFHHPDKHKSFSVFRGDDGFWHWKCFAGCGEGDEIMFLSNLKGLSLMKAMNLYLDMADFPASRPPKSHESPKGRECPESRESPQFHECPVYPVHPVSNGQALEEELQGLAARNACTRAEDTAERKRFKLARDVRALEKRIGRELTTAELRLTCDEWERASLPFLGWDDDDHFAMLLAELTKVRVPTGEGDTFNRALENVSKLPDSDLPEIPGYGDAPKPMRKLAALHREMSRLCGNKTYFLSCRDAAKASSGLSHQTAYNINLALAWPQLGVIKIVRVGDRRPKGKASKLKASEFKYLLSQTEKGAPHAENERDASKDGEGQNAGDCPF